MKLYREQMQLKSDSQLDSLMQSHQPEPSEQQMDEPAISDQLAAASTSSHQPVQLDKSTQPIHPSQSDQPSAGDYLDDNLVELFQKCSKSKSVPILFSIQDPPYCDSFAQSSAHLPLQYFV